MKKLRVGVVGIGHIGSNHARLYAEIPAAVQRGKHLLIEKPIAENPQHATELAELAARNQLILQVGHVERFNPVLSALEARLTHPRFIEAHRLSSYPNRSTDIGVVLDLMIHDLEIILHLVRSPVQNIDAVGVPVLSRSEDIANARIRLIYRREGGKITRDKVPIEREEPLKQQLVSFIECASTGRQPRVSGFQATAALELAVEITKRIGSSG